jgi:hypothetical protein
MSFLLVLNRDLTERTFWVLVGRKIFVKLFLSILLLFFKKKFNLNLLNKVPLSELSYKYIEIFEPLC